MSDPFAPLRPALAPRYELGDEIGRGGMSVVFRARDVEHQRDVAVKVLLPELSATVARDRFLREIRLEVELQHPHVVEVLDSGEEAGFVFLVLSLVEGRSLRERLAREGALPLDDALEIFRDVADALGHAHERGIVHRDVKPANILLSPHGALVTDFGVARAVNAVAGATLTDSGFAIGTPTYMAPEQAGESKHADARADVYSLGCVLFEMLAGEPPFQGTTPQAVTARHMMEKVPTLSVVRPGVPRSVERAIERALSKAPADRFSSMAAFVEALTAPVRDESAVMGWPAVAGAVAVMAALLGVGWWVLGGGPPLDDRGVVVFPLTEVGVVGTPGVAGETVALAIVSALEATDPLRVEDGFAWLTPDQRGNIRLLGGADAQAITRDRGARYWVDGEIVGRTDSVHVTLRLHDLAGGRVSRWTEVAPRGTDGTVQGGLRATVALLPSLLEEGRSYELPGLLDRDPGGVALWMLGNRAYRASDFPGALALYRRALEADDRLARAALRAAPAASWGGDLEEAGRLVEHALARRDELPERFVHFAEGLQGYLSGSADSAVARLNAALEADSSWEDAWMALGEVHRHLLPRGGGGAEAALAAFLRARQVDGEFTPPLYHIAELSAWRGDFEASKEAARALRDAGGSQRDVHSVTWVERCIEDGMSVADWSRAVEEDAGAAFDAATSLAVSKEHVWCASDAFQELFFVEDLDDTVPFGRYDAAMALQSLLVARGFVDSASTVIVQAVDEVTEIAAGFWVLDAVAGAPTQQEALRFIEEHYGLPDTVSYDTTRSNYVLWLLGQWESFQGHEDRLGEISAVLARRAESSDRSTRLWAAVAEAHLTILRGDSLGALAQLRALRPTATRKGLLWSVGDPLGAERIHEAELLLALGRPREAIAAAAEMDSPASMVTLLHLPYSLELRIRASEQLGDDETARFLRARLQRLSEGPSTREGTH